MMRPLVISLLLALPVTAQLGQGDLVTSGKGHKGTMHYYRFSNEQVALKVIPRGSFSNLAAAMKGHHCVAGCNGGFFDPEYRPLGAVIADGQASGRRNLSSSLTSGVIYESKDTLAIARARPFYERKIAPRQLLQTGPFLVENGKAVTGLSNRKRARRTLIATDGKGGWLLAYTPFITLAQLAQSLAESDRAFDIEIKTALNLDGGSSSALWVQGEHGASPFYRREIKPVANYLGLVLKEKE